MKHHFQLKINNIETKHTVSLLSRNTIDNVLAKSTDSKVKIKICNKWSSPLTHSRGRNKSRSYFHHRIRCSSINFHSTPNRKSTSPIDIPYLTDNNFAINLHYSNSKICSCTSRSSPNSRANSNISRFNSSSGSTRI